MAKPGLDPLQRRHLLKVVGGGRSAQRVHLRPDGDSGSLGPVTHQLVRAVGGNACACAATSQRAEQLARPWLGGPVSW